MHEPKKSGNGIIRKTKNYRMFKVSKDNRLLKVNKHKKLLESMRKYGFLPYWPIVVFKMGQGKYKVLDGQHRLDIAEQLSLSIFYVVSSTEFNIAEINNTQKPWQARDYAESYAEQGIEPYVEGLKFTTDYRIGVTSAFALLGGANAYCNIELSFKEGTFEVTDREWAQDVVSVYCPIVALEPCVRNNRFLEACMLACRLKEFDSPRMVQGAQKCRDKLASYSTRDAYLTMMEDIYNFHRKHLFALKVEATKVLREKEDFNSSNNEDEDE